MSTVKSSPVVKPTSKPVKKARVSSLSPMSQISQVRRERGSDVFQQLRDMAISYELKPGERLSEIELAQRLGVSRTPVREALARLVTEGFLEPCTRGYMRRPLQVQDVLDLYEARMAIERECLRYAVERATAEQIAEMQAFLAESRAADPATPVRELVEWDEAFHNRIAAMSGNGELARMLNNLNERVRFIRWIDMARVGRDSTQSEHGAIADAIAQRDRNAAANLMDEHIALRREQIVDAVTQGLARIFLGEEVAVV